MSNVFEEKNMSRALLVLGVPAMLGELTTLIYNLADTYFVSLTRNATQIAAVTLCTPILLIMMSIAIIFGMGGSSVIARLIGEGRNKDAANCFDFCIYAMIASSMLVMAVGLLFTGQIAHIAGADSSNYAYTCDYLRWIFIGAPALITVMLSVSNIVLNNYIGIYGSDAVASYGIAYKIDMFPIMLSVGFSQGIAPLLGYYFGKTDSKRLSKAMRLGTIYELILGGIFTTVIFTGSRQLAGIFLKDAEIVSMTSLFLKLLCFHAIFLGVINIVTAYFQALGKALNSLIITVLRNIILFIPGAVLLNHFFGLNGVILNQLIVEIILAGICSVMYILNLPDKLIQQIKKINY